MEQVDEFETTFYCKIDSECSTDCCMDKECKAASQCILFYWVPIFVNIAIGITGSILLSMWMAKCVKR